MCNRVCGVTVVLLLSVVLGLFFSGNLGKTGLFRLIASFDTLAVGAIPGTLSDEELNSFTFNDIPDLTGRVSLITGANAGVGYYTALHLARHGCTVILACRSTKKCNEAAENIRRNSTKITGKIIPMEVDISSLSSVDKFSKEIREKFDRLDVTVFNAGIGGLFGDYVLSADGFESVFATNSLGHVKLFLDLQSLIESTAKKHSVATITHVSSVAHTFVPYAPGIFDSVEFINNSTDYVRLRVYERTKLYNVMTANKIARIMRNNNVNVLSNSAHPGFVLTNIFDENLQYIHQNFPEMIANIMEYVWLVVMEKYAWSSEGGSLCQLYTSVSKEIIAKKISGAYFQPIRSQLPTNILVNDENMDIFWKFCVKLIQGKGYNLDYKF